MALQAIECFSAQTYQFCELLILEDCDKPTLTNLDPLPNNVRLMTAPERYQIGRKRNMLADAALGYYVCHWDSDDWSDPRRIATQVELIQKSGLAVHAFHWLHFCRRDPLQVFYYCDSAHYPMGTSLFYRRDFWQTHQFENVLPINSGEDGRFCKAARAVNQISSDPTNGLMVARLHDDNTSPKNLKAPYRPVPVTDLPENFRLFEGI